MNRHPLNFLRVPDLKNAERPRTIFGRAWRALGLPRRGRSELERTAAQGRATRLFAVNFRSTWIR